MFSSRIPLKSLATVCRALSTMLASGIAVQKAFDLAATKTSNPKARHALREVADAIRRGEDVSSAMRSQDHRFPPLTLDMIEMAEESGALPEVLKHLAEHYENNSRLQKIFITALIWPMFQLFAAIFIIALLIFILGWVAQSRGGEPLDVLGLGLTGGKGAALWLWFTLGSLAGLFLLYHLIRNSVSGKQKLDPLLMRIPVLGPCLESFAIARFSWAFWLTQQTGMSILRSLDSSLRATGNGAFISASPEVRGRVKEGETLSDALAAVNLFPQEFIEMVYVAETSGTVPETLDRLSPEFEDQARRRLQMLVTALGWVIWGLIATFIIFFIFRIALFYVGQIDNALQAI